MTSPTRVAAAALIFLATVSAVHSIGVNYGTLADNLPPPSQVAEFLKDKTTIDRIKIFDVNPDILRAFANTGILVAVTIPNGEIPNLTNIRYARRYLAKHITPFHPQTKINYILIGNEILHWGPQLLIDNLVTAMSTVHKALHLEKIFDVKVTTAHSTAILEPTDLPSEARFRPGWDRGVLEPLLKFHRDTGSPFMVNPYPYFSYGPEKADLCLFRPNKGVFDKFTKRTYGNMYDILLDSIFTSMEKLGYGDVEIVVGETGWASDGEVFEKPKVSVANAASYNWGLVDHYNSGRGTPLMPKRKFETYIFALFNENQKTGSFAEKNFGLFRPDFSSVYDAGVMRAGAAAAPVVKPTPTPGVGGKKWCVAKADASEAALQNNINYACSQAGIDCKPIQTGGACHTPSSVRAYASFAMSSYYHAKGPDAVNCDFGGTGVLTSTNPSTGSCLYP